MFRKKVFRNKFVIGALVLLMLATTGMVSVVLYSEYRLAKLVPGGLGDRFPTKIYSSAWTIRNHDSVSTSELLERLKELDYRATNATPLALGSFDVNSSSIKIALRGFQTPSLVQTPIVISLTRESDNHWTLTDGNGNVLDQVSLEPEVVAELSGPQKVRREPAAWTDFPQSLLDAVVAVEDRRFYKHNGLDFRAILRAAWYNLRHRKNLQGGSTITQQLAKNFFLTQERTLQRKLMEAAFAVYLNFRFSKERILTLYLNQIYMGQDGAVSIAGVKAAADYYFGKPLKNLDVSESALLAGIIRSPYRYNPFQNIRAARERRDTVLRVMMDETFLTEPEYVKASSLPVIVRNRKTTPGPETANNNDYFVAEVIRQLVPHFSEDVLFRYGLKIYSTLDPRAQRLAQTAVKTQKNQAAVVVLDPRTGAVAALVGGKNFKESQFNRATQARRQPGSAFKPFLYGAALENGFTPASLLQDQPRAYRTGKKVWAPRNFDGVYRGAVTLRDALAHSMNGASLDLAQKLGTHNVVKFATRVGIESPLENSLALALGASEVTPFELTSAYAAFANGGFHVNPYLVTAVADYENNVLERNTSERQQVLEPALSYLVTSLLQTTVTDGTAKTAKELGWSGTSAGKTGTTNAGRDAWFIGYTADLLAGVWVGDDEARAAHLSGTKNALPVWVSFMKNYYGDRVPADFEKPAGVTTVKIDPASGLLARSGCPNQKEEIFVTGTEPTVFCTLHPGGFKGWLMKFFRKKI